jgi:hypothetical protein
MAYCADVSIGPLLGGQVTTTLAAGEGRVSVERSWFDRTRRPEFGKAVFALPDIARPVSTRCWQELRAATELYRSAAHRFLPAIGSPTSQAQNRPRLAEMGVRLLLHCSECDGSDALSA